MSHCLLRRRSEWLGLICLGVLVSVLPGNMIRGAAASDASVENSSRNAFDLAAWLDRRFGRIWGEQDVTPGLCDDETYLRRVSLDLIGRIPNVAELRSFLADDDPHKRVRVVEHLLASPDDVSRAGDLHAEHLARIWRRMMFPPGSQGAAMGQRFEPWLREHFQKGTAYDRIVRQLLTARGEGSLNEMIYYQAVGGTPDAQATEFSRVFLGIRIGCAQCHDHPFTDWKQEDFWGMAAFFNGTRLSGQAVPGLQIVEASPGLNDEDATGTISYEGESYRAKTLWSAAPVSLEENQRPRDALAEWMISKENPTFAANVVNRVWQHLLGRGLVAEVDDLDLATEQERSLVLDDLAELFAESGYDLRWLIAGICKSQAYQCSSASSDDQPASLLAGRRPLKTLTPEQMFDSLEQALLLPVSVSNAAAARHNGQMQQVVQRLDESIGTSPEEYTAGVPQTLMLMNGPLLSAATDLERSHTLRAVVDAPFLTDVQKIDTLYLAAVTRLAREDEREMLLNHVRKRKTDAARKTAYGDIFWALLNSPEFVLCR